MEARGSSRSGGAGRCRSFSLRGCRRDCGSGRRKHSFSGDKRGRSHGRFAGDLHARRRNPGGVDTRRRLLRKDRRSARFGGPQPACAYNRREASCRSNHRDPAWNSRAANSPISSSPRLPGASITPRPGSSWRRSPRTSTSPPDATPGWSSISPASNTSAASGYGC